MEELTKLAKLLGLEITTKQGMAFDQAIGIPMGTPEYSYVINGFNFSVCENGLMVTLVEEDEKNNWSVIAYKFSGWEPKVNFTQFTLRGA
jgi:hypothetical protein